MTDKQLSTIIAPLIIQAQIDEYEFYKSNNQLLELMRTSPKMKVKFVPARDIG